MDATKALKEIYLFRDLPEDALRSLAQIAESRTEEQGRTIVSEGDHPDFMYVIRSGSVRVFKQAGGDQEDVVILGTGSHFGEVSLVDDAPRSATVVANERCELFVLPIEKFRQKIDSDRNIAFFLYRALARSLAKRLRQVTGDLGFARHLVKERTR